MKTKFDLQIGHIPTCQPVYRKLASADYHFESEVLYTFADIGRLIGVSSMGIRQRALYDQWPLVSVHVHKGQGRRNHYVKGEFPSSHQIGGLQARSSTKQGGNTMSQYDISELKQICPMPKLMHCIGLGQYAKSSCRSPFREDSKPSF